MDGTLCARCDTKLVPQASYCHQCGTAAWQVAEVERRWCSVIFADVRGFTNMAEGLDAEIVQQLMHRLFGRLSHLVESHGGTVDKIIGDAIMALFGVPKASGDDAERAVLCGLAIHTISAEVGQEMGLDLQMRVGINTGEVIAGPLGRASEFTVIGDTVNVASRLEGAAASGQVIVGQATASQVGRRFDLAPVGELHLKGREKTEPAFLVLGGRDRFASNGQVRVERLIGRKQEMEQLELWRNEAKQNRRLILLEGQRGFGRAHLVDVFRQGIAEVHLHSVLDPIVRAASWCLPTQLISTAVTGDANQDPDIATLAYWLGDASALADPLALLHGLPGALGERSISDGLAAWEQLLQDERFANINIIVEEAHQLDDDSITWLKLWANQGGAGMLLLSCLPSEGRLADSLTELENVERLQLGPLKGQGLLDWAEHSLGHCSPGLVDQLAEMSGGSPAHLVELIKVWRTEQVVTQDDQGIWQLDEARQLAVAIPGSLRELLQARIDQLPRTPRYLLQRCSAIGRIFWQPVAERVAIGDATEVAAALDYLVENGWLARYADPNLPEVKAYRIINTMVTEVAAMMLPLTLRKTLHAKVADWLKERVGDRKPGLRSQFTRHLMLSSDDSAPPESITEQSLKDKGIVTDDEVETTGPSFEAEQLWLREADVTRALACLDSIEEEGPEGLALRAQLAIESDQPAQAYDFAREASKHLARDADSMLAGFVLLTRAEAAEAQGLMRSMTRELRELDALGAPPSQQVQARLLKTRAALRKGDGEDAVTLVEEAWSSAASVKSPVLRMEVLLERASVLLTAGRLDAVARLLEEAAKLAEGLSSQLFQLRLRAIWIRHHFDSGQEREALALLPQLLERTAAGGLLRMNRRARLLSLYIGRRDSAEQVLDQAEALLRISTDVGARDGEAVALAALARIKDDPGLAWEALAKCSTCRDVRTWLQVVDQVHGLKRERDKELYRAASAFLGLVSGKVFDAQLRHHRLGGL